MKSRMESRGSLMSAAVLALALCLSGCGDDEVQPGTDAGTEDSGTPDSGTPDSGTPDAGPAVVDSDLAVVRLNSDGSVDTSFGAGGTSRLDLSTVAGGTRDVLSGLAVDSSSRPILFGSKRADGDRVDSDRVVVRLTAAGALDTAFGTGGVHTLNIGNLNDIPKQGIVDPDGKIVMSGYTNQPTGVGSQSANRIVLSRLDADGKLDNTFGWKGVVNSAPFGAQQDGVNLEWGMVEAYAVGRQSTGHYVTTGYGRRAPSGTVDLVSFRYTANGQFDTSYGNQGVALLDLVGDNERGRHMAVLSDDRVCSVGSGTPVAGKISAMVYMLTANGAADAAFAAEGYKLYDFERPEQAFFGVATSPDGNWVAAAGYRAGGNQDDDAVLALIPVRAGTGPEVAKAVPVSETENDRFWAVAFDSQNRAYAAGFVTEGGDSRMVVARYTTAGALDTTFGTGGIVKLNIVTGKTEEAVRGIAILPDGKIVIAGSVDK
jgi:uncharacterized delta-60 repeat protein